ncbi:MAG: hypothetical protein R3Y54_11630 [Eubacteriales bacterium]
MKEQVGELVDLLTIQIDETLSKEERIQSYMEQVRNPYHFKVGKVEVQVGFSDDGITFEQRFQEYLSCL